MTTIGKPMGCKWGRQQRWVKEKMCRTEEMFKKNTHNEHEHKKTCLYPRDSMSGVKFGS